jgi:hypothetical protein
MGGKSARTKGHSFERAIAIKIREIDKTARRNVSECQQASVDILTDLPLAIQCKALNNWSKSPTNIYAQAAEGRLHEEDIPVGIVKIDNRQPILCFIALEHFLEWVKIIYGKKEETKTTCSCHTHKPQC